MRRAAWSVLSFLGLAATGCISIGGGNDYVRAVYYPSMAEEGEALDAAKAKGILTEAEVDQAKQKLLTEGRKF